MLEICMYVRQKLHFKRLNVCMFELNNTTLLTSQKVKCLYKDYISFSYLKVFSFDICDISSLDKYR
jgi:hypothetical protein